MATTDMATTDMATTNMATTNTEATNTKPRPKTKRLTGPPSMFGRFEAFVTLFSFVALVLTLVAMAAPAWKTFVDRQNNYYEVGLWSICKNGQCTNNWVFTPQSRPFNGTALGLDPQSGSSDVYAYSYVPSIIAAAQALYIIGVILHMLGAGLWFAGFWFAFVGNLVPAAYYTAATGCAAYFFDNPRESLDLENLPNDVAPFVIDLRWGYAAICAFTSVALIWVAVIAFLVDYCWHYARGTFVVDVEEAAKKPSNTVDAMPPMSRVTSDEDAILEIKERHSSLGVVDVGL